MRRAVRVIVLLGLTLGGCDRVFGLERSPPDAPPPPEPGAWITVTSGVAHACAIQGDHSLWCWGENANGQVGATDLEVTSPAHIGTAEWMAVAPAFAHTCGIQLDGTLWCWGYNGFGSLGDGTHVDHAAPTQVGTDHWTSVASAEYTSCAIRADHSLWCWGQNLNAQIGDGTTSERAMPVLVDATHSWGSVAVGLTHACGVTSDHALFCWGTGPLAVAPMSLVPLQLAPDLAWTAIAAGYGFSCGLAGGTAYCWGDGPEGELGDGMFDTHVAPAPIVSPHADWTQIAIRNRTACAIAADGALACWGENQHGQIGSDTAPPHESTPFAITAPAEAWNVVAPGGVSTCAIDSSAHLWCSGGNGYGQRGDGTGGSRLVPLKIDDGYTKVVTGQWSTCGLRAGALWCWGENSSGQLGDGTLDDEQVPVQTLMVGPTAKLAVGTTHTCNVDTMGRLWCWGDNSEARLQSSPYPFENKPRYEGNFAPTVGELGADAQTCVVGSDAHGYCWGRNTSGQLGRGTTSPYESSLLPVTDGASALFFATIGTGAAHSCGIANTSIVYCWGRNAEGQLGTGNLTPSTVGTPTVLVASRLSVGNNHTCAINAQNTLSCWGDNTYAQLGDGTSTRRTSPTALAGTWLAVSAGATHTCGIKTDGSLWCWGESSRGQLGLGTRTGSLVPVRVGSAMWQSVSAGASYTCGVQIDGSLWCWGNRSLGQLGDNQSWNTKLVQVAAP